MILLSAPPMSTAFSETTAGNIAVIEQFFLLLKFVNL